MALTTGALRARSRVQSRRISICRGRDDLNGPRMYEDTTLGRTLDVRCSGSRNHRPTQTDMQQRAACGPPVYSLDWTQPNSPMPALLKFVLATILECTMKIRIMACGMLDTVCRHLAMRQSACAYLEAVRLALGTQNCRCKTRHLRRFLSRHHLLVRGFHTGVS